MSTVVAPLDFNAVEDAEALHKACKGWGTNEKAIISILGRRTADQRQMIREAYAGQFQEDLVKRLESEISGDFERAVYRWMLHPAERDAVLAHVAIRKVSPDYDVVVEIACTLTPEELLEVRRAYRARYKQSLEEDVAAHTSGDMRKLLVGLVSAYRYDGEEINARLAVSEADILHDCIKDKDFNHEDVIRILSTRSKTQLIATFNRYRDDQGTSITKCLLSEEHDEFVKAMRTAVRCIKDPKKYFEKVLRNSIKRIGTDEDALTRVIVRRAEKDLNDIKELYYKRNSVTLEHAVSKDTSGDYKAFLLTLMGKED